MGPVREFGTLQLCDGIDPEGNSDYVETNLKDENSIDFKEFIEKIKTGGV